MAESDLSKLDYAGLVKLHAETQALIEAKRTEEIKVLADGFAKKLQAQGLSIADAIVELKKYLPVSTRSGNGERKSVVNPANPSQVYGGRGPKPKWLKELEAGPD